MLSCADCKCVENICKNISPKNCTRCTKRICCCQGIHKCNERHSILLFLHHTKTLFAAALGIEYYVYLQPLSEKMGHTIFLVIICKVSLLVMDWVI